MPQACAPGLLPAQAQPTQPGSSQARALFEVRKGSTLGSLAKTYKVDPQTLLAANGLKSAKDIRPGMRLMLPGPASAVQQAMAAPQPAPQAAAQPQGKAADAKGQAKTPEPKSAAEHKAAPAPAQKPTPKNYSVGSGETVWSIARKLKVDPHAILAWNNLDKSAQLRPGDKLKIFQ